MRSSLNSSDKIHVFLNLTKVPPAPTKNTSWIVILITACIVLINYAINILIRSSIYLDSLNFIYNYQQSGSHFVTFVQNIISSLCNPLYLTGVLIILYLSVRRKISLLVFLVFFVGNVYLNLIAKLAFADPRPFWYDYNIQLLQWRCNQEYGNPSGHARSVLQFYEPLFVDIIVQKSHSIYTLVVPFILAILVPLSRMYLGAHSANQVLMGLILGLAYLVLYRYFLRQKIYCIYESLIKDKHSKTLFWLLTLNILLFLIPLIIYQINLYHPTEEKYMKNLMNACLNSNTYTPTKVLSKNLTACAISNIIFGLLVGIYFSRPSNFKYLYGQWSYRTQGVQGALSRVLIELLPTLIPVVVLFVILPIFIVNDYLRYLCESLGLWLGGFMMTYSADLLLSRFGIYGHNDPQLGILRSIYDVCGQ